MWQLKSAFHTFGLCLKEKCNQVRGFRFKKRGYGYTDGSQRSIKAISGTNWRPKRLISMALCSVSKSCQFSVCDFRSREFSYLEELEQWWANP